MNKTENHRHGIHHVCICTEFWHPRQFQKGLESDTANWKGWNKNIHFCCRIISSLQCFNGSNLFVFAPFTRQILLIEKLISGNSTNCAPAWVLDEWGINDPFCKGNWWCLIPNRNHKVLFMIRWQHLVTSCTKNWWELSVLQRLSPAKNNLKQVVNKPTIFYVKWEHS